MKTLVGDKAPEPGRETTGNMGVFVCSGEELGSLHAVGRHRRILERKLLDQIFIVERLLCQWFEGS